MKYRSIALLALSAYKTINVAAQRPLQLRARLYTEDRAAEDNLELSYFNVLAQDMSIISDTPSARPSEAPCK